MSADALIARFEQEKSRALGRSLRRHAGLYYTPPEIAARVMEVALRSTGGAVGRVLDPCAGEGAAIKQLGEFTVPVRLQPDVEASLKVAVKAE